MMEIVITIGVIGISAAFCVSIIVIVKKAFAWHDPERAAASVKVAANVAFELQLPGTPGKVFFRYDINKDTEFDFDLLVTGEIDDERGGTRAFAVKTSTNSRLEGADCARYAGVRYAGSTNRQSISLATVQTGDRAVRGVVTEHPSALLRTGWVYVPRYTGTISDFFGGGRGRRDLSAADMLASGELGGAYAYKSISGNTATWTITPSGPGSVNVASTGGRKAPLYGTAQLNGRTWTMVVHRPDVVKHRRSVDTGSGTSTFTWDAITLKGKVATRSDEGVFGRPARQLNTNKFTLTKII